jgi:Na+-transporting NADH:ubiquinone oxidoreductase subunit NqrC
MAVIFHFRFSAILYVLLQQQKSEQVFEKKNQILIVAISQKV